MTPRKHQFELFALAVAFTLLHFCGPQMWPFYSLTGFMFVLWLLNVISDAYYKRLDARVDAYNKRMNDSTNDAAG